LIEFKLLLQAVEFPGQAKVYPSMIMYPVDAVAAIANETEH
jgi:hypothetical protein